MENKYAKKLGKDAKSLAIFIAVHDFKSNKATI